MVKGRHIAGLGALGAALVLAGYLITGFESPGGRPVLHVYPDPATGGAPWTYCDGETQNPKFGHTYTVAECDAETSALLRTVDAAVVGCTRNDLPDKVRAAFDSLAWNIGTGAFCKSTAARRARAGDLRGACEALAWFVYAAGKRMPGLEFRRGEEKRICLEGLT